MKKFHQYLYGPKFQLITDHKLLRVILGPKIGVPSLAAARLQRWAILLSVYSYDIVFKPTNHHGNADGLCRLPLPDERDPSVKIGSHTSSVFNISQMQALPITATDIGAATKQDRILSKVYRYTKTTWPSEITTALKPYHQCQHQLTVEGDCLLWGIRVVVPRKH